jgi:hypothetical protein
MTTQFRPLSGQLWQQYCAKERQIRVDWQCQQGNLVYLLEELSQTAQLLCSDIEAAGQPLMQEWLLKRWLFFLSDLARASRQAWLRQLFLDRLYQPMLALFALFRRYTDGQQRQCALQADIQRFFAGLQAEE